MTQINGAQRTRKQAYKHILQQLDAGLLGATVNGSCVYEQQRPGKTTLHCGVGCLFNKSQIKDIKRLGLNDSMVETLAIDIGTENIEAVTGLTLSELEYLQSEHDIAFDRLGDECDLTEFREMLLNRIAAS